MYRFIALLLAFAFSMLMVFGKPSAADPLLDAVKAGDAVSVAEELSKKDTNTCAAWVSRPLAYAVEDGFAGIVELLVDGCPDPRAAFLFGGSLRLAARNDDAVIVGILLEHGADPNSVDRTTGQSALHIASVVGALSVVRVLVAADADVDLRDSQNLQAIDLALRGDHEAVAELLRTSGAE